MRAALWLLLSLTLACGPAMLETKTPDRSTSIAIVEELEGNYILARGERWGPYEKIVAQSLQPSPDGVHIAWVAGSEDDGWTVYIDGQKQSEPWRGIGEVLWSPRSDRLVYAATDEPLWYIVTPEGRGPAFDAIGKGSIQFDASGAKLGYIGLDPQGAFVVVDGKEIGPFRGAGRLALDRDGSHFAFHSIERDGYFVHVDGDRYGPYVDVAELALGARLGRFAASVLTREGWRALVDGRLVDVPCTKIGSFRFSADASRVAWASASADPSSKQEVWTVQVDDRVLGPYERVDHQGLVFSSDASAFAFTAGIAGRERVVVNGEPSTSKWTHAKLLSYAANAPVLGYVGTDDRGAAVVIGGEEKARFDTVTDLALDPSGERWLAAAELSGATLIVVDGKPLSYDVVAAGTLSFDPSGSHWGAIAGDGAERSLWFIIDGIPTTRLLFDEIADLVQRHRGLDGGGQIELALHGWVQAELARTVRAVPKR